MRFILSALIGVSALFASVCAEPGRDNENPVLVELFTSQSCSSCVSATEYSRELVKRDDLVLLAWHVDYWNELRTRSGKWVDPYSSQEFTERQRRYNMAIRAQRSVYTPQTVVNGVFETVGSNRKTIPDLINKSERADPSTLSVHRRGDLIEVQTTAPEMSEILIATFYPEVNTAVSGGENAGHEFFEVNVVKDLKKIGQVNENGMVYTAKAPEDGLQCALFVQSPKQGRIHAARYCP